MKFSDGFFIIIVLPTVGLLAGAIVAGAPGLVIAYLAFAAITFAYLHHELEHLSEDQ